MKLETQPIEALPRDAWQHLSQRLTPARKQKMEAVASKRTKWVRLVLQDVHDPHNVAACLRSAEALGIMNVDIITMHRPNKKSAAARGTGHWLNIKTWPSIEACCQHLKQEGFVIAAGFPPAQATTTLFDFMDLKVEKPIALLFGNERTGIHQNWFEFIDIKFTIPTVGMVESLNISVSAPISLMQVTRASRLHMGDEKFYLNHNEQLDILANWLCARIRKPSSELKLRRSRDSNPL